MVDNMIPLTTDVDAPIRPVFVVGMNGSGTTMLVDCLGRHPQLYAFRRETRVLPYIIERYRDPGALRRDEVFQRLWKDVLAIPEFVRINGNRPLSMPSDWNRYPRAVGTVIDYGFRQFAAREGKTRWCEKTPQHLQHMETLLEVFPKAKIIHILRDGRDCAASFHRRWQRTPELTAFRWRNVVARGRASGAGLGDNYFELRYEDLTREPESYMRQVCAFVEAPYDPAVLVSRRPQSERAGELGAMEANEGRWREYFSSRQLSRLHAIAGEQLATLGYEVPGPLGNWNPPQWQLRLWQVKDYGIQYANEIWQKLTGRSTKSWRLLLQLPTVAFRQQRTNRF